jgi:hypothetical protein
MRGDKYSKKKTSRPKKTGKIPLQCINDVGSDKEDEIRREEETGKIPCLANSVMMWIYIRKRRLAEKRKQERFVA